MLDRHERTHSILMKFILFNLTALLLTLLPAGNFAVAWGPVGHSVIGRAAMAQLGAEARSQVMDILEASTEATLEDAVDDACFWPDTVRDSPQWSWSGPLHYVNIPRSSGAYDRQRDCPDGLCVTEGIPKYAAELGRPGLDPERRWQAFAWLCHLVGDVHQPLHAGFRDDRGGNRVDIEYRGERSNLHRFWDSMLAAERLSESGRQPAVIDDSLIDAASHRWRPADVVAWTEESHALAAGRAYPPGPVIDEEFADASWGLVRQQWSLAAARLAAILNTVLVDETAGTDR
jgi:hypothetical protein